MTPPRRVTRPRSFRLYIDIDNEAFSPEPDAEIARILRSVADKIEQEGASRDYQNVRDFNGNTVGRYAIKPDAGKG